MSFTVPTVSDIKNCDVTFAGGSATCANDLGFVPVSISICPCDLVDFGFKLEYWIWREVLNAKDS
jgi:hypothetical protein